MPLDHKFEFSPDKPISTSSEDLLSRANFAKSLANALSIQNDNESLVVSINGDWGSGKSSIKNMVISELQKNDKQPDIIEFTPWEWAGQEKINESFFNEIAAKIGHSNSSKDDKKLANTILKYGHYLNTGSILVKGLSTVIPYVFLIGLWGVGNNFISEDLIQISNNIFLVIFAILIAIMKWGQKLAVSISKSYKLRSELNAESLPQLRKCLIESLKKRNKSIVVVMDDIDRLTKEQLLMIIQLVKANSQFPKVTFVLIYQNDIVEKKLTDDSQNGADYLKKIIQVPITVPKIDTSQVHKVLTDKLGRIIDSDQRLTQHFNKADWGNIFNGALFIYFDDLRSVNRFISTFSFHVQFFQMKDSFEVNPVDLIAIECLRVFEPSLYKTISHSKDLLTKSKEENNNDERKARLEEIVSLSKTPVVKELLIQLFPHIEQYFGGTSYSGYHDAWLKSLRVCHHSHFDKYFYLQIPSDSFSQSEINNLLNNIHDRKKLENQLMIYQEEGRLKNMLFLFNSYLSEIPDHNVRYYISALINFSDHVVNGSSLWGLDESMHIYFQIISLLKRFDINKRCELLESSIIDSEGISILHMILFEEEKKQAEDPKECFITPEILQKLISVFISRINEQASTNPLKLLKNKNIGTMLYRWEEWGDKEDLKKWLSCLKQNDSDYIELLNVFLSEGQSWSEKDYVTRQYSYFDIERFKHFMDLDELIVFMYALDISTLTPNQKEVINKVNLALNKES